MAENKWLWMDPLNSKTYSKKLKSKKQEKSAKNGFGQSKMPVTVTLYSMKNVWVKLLEAGWSFNFSKYAKGRILMKKNMKSLKNWYLKSQAFSLYEETVENLPKDDFQLRLLFLVIRYGRVESGDATESPLSARYPRLSQYCPRQDGLIITVSDPRRKETQRQRRRVSFRYCYHQSIVRQYGGPDACADGPPHTREQRMLTASQPFKTDPLKIWHQ